MTYGSLFSGVGGMDLGLDRAGMECKWQCEIEPFCLKVLEKHWPNVKRYTDIRKIDAAELEPVDLICGGYPCQPFSLAGKRGGDQDERHLWPDFARILRVLRPRYALMENVPGHLSMGFGDVLRDLAESGYDAEWSCLSACAMGASHMRNRVFIVAYSNQIRSSRRREKWSRFGIEALSETPLRWDMRAPYVCRGSDGIPKRLDRLKALGNAVVPQVAEWIGRRIMEHHAATR